MPWPGTAELSRSFRTETGDEYRPGRLSVEPTLMNCADLAIIAFWRRRISFFFSTVYGLDVSGAREDCVRITST